MRQRRSFGRPGLSRKKNGMEFSMPTPAPRTRGRTPGFVFSEIRRDSVRQEGCELSLFGFAGSIIAPHMPFGKLSL